jgi:hypothetical protein
LAEEVVVGVRLELGMVYLELRGEEVLILMVVEVEELEQQDKVEMVVLVLKQEKVVVVVEGLLMLVLMLIQLRLVMAVLVVQSQLLAQPLYMVLEEVEGIVWGLLNKYLERVVLLVLEMEAMQILMEPMLIFMVVVEVGEVWLSLPLQLVAMVPLVL